MNSFVEAYGPKEPLCKCLLVVREVQINDSDLRGALTIL